MLGKLLKHELKETAKPLIPLNLALLAITVIGAFLLSAQLFQNDSAGVLTVSAMLLYMLMIFALFIITGVYLMIRFYRTMYSNRGYLTHTLPVSTTSVLNTKIFVSVFWIAVALVITVISVFVLMRSAVGPMWDFVDFATVKAEFATEMGMSIGEFFLYAVIISILSCCSIVLMVAASIAIGQLFHQYRIVAAIVAYIGFYIIQQIFGVVSMLIFGTKTMGSLFVTEAEVAANEMASLYDGIFLISIVQTLVFCIVYYIICHYITNKKLNLE